MVLDGGVGGLQFGRVEDGKVDDFDSSLQPLADLLIRTYRWSSVNLSCHSCARKEDELASVTTVDNKLEKVRL